MVSFRATATVPGLRSTEAFGRGTHGEACLTRGGGRKVRSQKAGGRTREGEWDLASGSAMSSPSSRSQDG